MWKVLTASFKTKRPFSSLPNRNIVSNHGLISAERETHSKEASKVTKSTKLDCLKFELRILEIFSIKQLSQPNCMSPSPPRNFGSFLGKVRSDWEHPLAAFLFSSLWMASGFPTGSAIQSRSTWQLVNHGALDHQTVSWLYFYFREFSYIF